MPPQTTRPSWAEWIVATVVAAVAMISYVHQFVYPRTEGEKLEKRVDLLDEHYRDDVKGVRERLDQIMDRLTTK
jgi:hypothetical protein